ncbi:hypothetical protein LTR50_006885 [Elasticomyces elasticus]|nr:hypothetical protein LTR50_006885 [Elasticomyces elasticus]
MLSFLTILALLCIPPTLYKLFSFAKNIQSAKATGLPYTISPLHEFEIWTYITDPILRRAYADYLMKDKGWPKWARFMIKDWMYEGKGRAHKEFGGVFLVVSPGGIVCYVGNAKTAMSVCSRRKDFIKPPEKMKMLEPFGPNVVSTEGDLWRFHLRITLPPFGEVVNRLVWSETFRQTDLLASSWASVGSGSLKTDIYSLTVNVMSCVGFGKQAEWTDDANAVPAGHELTLVSSIFGVVNHLPHILLLPKTALKHSPWKFAYKAYVEFKKYMHEFLAEEKAKMTSDSMYESKVKGNVLTAVLKSNASNKKENIVGPEGRTSLTDDEILGNVFMFLLAGYDTTANTILFSSTVLTLYDDIQGRMIEEIDRVHSEAESAGRKELSYVEDLPKFRYILAFMYEVMRVFPIVIPIGRMVTREQELVVENASKAAKSTAHVLPPNTGVIVNNTGIHHSQDYWPNPHIIEPRRWLTSCPNTYDPLHPTPAQEAEILSGTVPIPSHIKGTFLTFNEGPRACLGRRFAQVEFIAFFSRLLKQYRLTLGGVARRDEVEKMIRLRSGGSPVTLVPPEDVKVYLTSRS